MAASAFRLPPSLCALLLVGMFAEGRQTTAPHNFTSGPEVVATLQRLQELPRAWRPRALRSLVHLANTEGGLAGGLTTPAYKLGIVELFKSSRWGQAAVFEVGSHKGHITSILSVLFGLVFASEIEFQLALDTSAGPLRRSPNVVHLSMDGSRPYGLSMLAANRNIRAAVIDGAHDERNVFLDTFRILHDIPCCTEVIVYHDYCDEVVYKTIQRFVEAGLLAFRHGLGVDPGTFWWCRGGRAEGGVFDVLRRDGPFFRRNLWALFCRHILKAPIVPGAQAGGHLNGSLWWVPEQGLMISLELPPAKVSVRTAWGDYMHFDIGYASFVGHAGGATHPRWGATALTVEVKDDVGGLGPSCANLVLDSECTGFTVAVTEHALGAGGACTKMAKLVQLNGVVQWVAMRVNHGISLLQDIHERSTSFDGDAQAITLGLVGR